MPIHSQGWSYWGLSNLSRIKLFRRFSCIFNLCLVWPTISSLLSSFSPLQTFSKTQVCLSSSHLNLYCSYPIHSHYFIHRIPLDHPTHQNQHHFTQSSVSLDLYQPTPLSINHSTHALLILSTPLLHLPLIYQVIKLITIVSLLVDFQHSYFTMFFNYANDHQYPNHSHSHPFYLGETPTCC